MDWNEQLALAVRQVRVNAEEGCRKLGESHVVLKREGLEPITARYRR